MFAATYLIAILACLVVLPVFAWVVGLAFRVLGWTLRGVFSLFGILLMPVWLVLLAVGGIAAAAPFLIPIAIGWLIVSAIAYER